jgi:hypothetical protein
VARLGLHNFIYQSVVQGLLRSEKEVSIAVLFDLLDGLLSEVGNVGVYLSTDEEDLLSLYLNVRSLSTRTSQRLVNHDPRVREGLPLAFSTGPCK